MNEKIDPKASTFVYGDDIASVLKFSSGSIIIYGRFYDSALILSVASMQKIKTISTKMSKIHYITYGHTINPVLSLHMVPGTDFGFMLECQESKFIFLRNIKTAQRQVFIQGSPNCPQRIPCIIFLKRETGYELHFCTKRRDKGSTVVSRYRWNLGPDFFKTLKTYKRLPLDMDIEKLMGTMK